MQPDSRLFSWQLKVGWVPGRVGHARVRVHGPTDRISSGFVKGHWNQPARPGSDLGEVLSEAYFEAYILGANCPY